MRFRMLAIGFAVLLLIIPVLRAADTLPSSLTDAEFWKMITEFSERGGTFDFEMYMSNEVTFQEILPDLLKRVAPGGVYLGVAPEQNFTYISALLPKMAFIIDIRRENMVEMLMYKALFEMSPTRSEFLSRLFGRRIPATVDTHASVSALFDALSRARGDSQFLAQTVQSVNDRLTKTHGFALTGTDLRTIDYILTLFFRGGPDAHLTTYGTSFNQLMRQTDGRGINRNFLTTEANYQFVKDMQKRNLIVPIVGDFAGPKAIRAVAGYLRSHAAEVSAFYVSNVEEYIQSPRSVWSSYCGNLAALPLSASSTFIRFYRGGRGTYIDPMPPFTKSCNR